MVMAVVPGLDEKTTSLAVAAVFGKGAATKSRGSDIIITSRTKMVTIRAINARYNQISRSEVRKVAEWLEQHGIWGEHSMHYWTDMSSLSKEPRFLRVDHSDMSIRLQLGSREFAIGYLENSLMAEETIISGAGQKKYEKLSALCQKRAKLLAEVGRIDREIDKIM